MPDRLAALRTRRSISSLRGEDFDCDVVLGIVRCRGERSEVDMEGQAAAS